MMKPLLSTTLFFVLTAFLTTLAAAQVIQGTVVDPIGNPVAEAIVEEADAENNKTVSDENGRFTLTAAGRYYEAAVFARTDDYSLAGIGRFARDGGELVEIRLELYPTTSLKARLITQTGEPLANVKVETRVMGFERERKVQVPYASLATDADGRFSMQGLILGKEYYLYSPTPHSSLNVTVGLFQALSPDEFDAGDITVPGLESINQQVEYSRNRSMEYILNPYRQKDSPVVRFENVLLKSKESQKPVLILLVYSELNDENKGFTNWIFSTIFWIQGQKYLAGYEYVPVDATNREQAAELAEKLGVKLPDENEFTIIVCDSDGKIITRRDSKNFNAPRFNPDGELTLEFDPVMLLTFLREFGK